MARCARLRVQRDVEGMGLELAGGVGNMHFVPLENLEHRGDVWPCK